MRKVGSVIGGNRATGMLLPGFAAALLACGMSGWAGAALAQGGRQQATQTRSGVPQPQGPVLALVSIGSQRINIYDRTGLIASAPISSGQRGHETPQGVFSIIEKKEEHFSNLYDDASMPYMQRITWSGVALHAGALPGYPASHGCIRLPHGFAQSLFGATKLNTRVVVTPGDVAPVPIEHPVLFQPRFEASVSPSGSGDKSSEGATPSRPALELKSDDGSAAPMMLGGRIAKPDAPAPLAPPAQKAVTTPLEAAAARRTVATQKVSAAAKAADTARLLVRTRLGESQKAARIARQAEFTQKRAETQLVWGERALAAAKTDDQRSKAEASRAKLIEDVATATKAAAEAKSAAEQRAAELKEAQAAIKDADQARKAAEAEVRDAARLSEPVSVFVSVKTARVYVRQGREPVLDMPIEIRDPSSPVGTFVFTAMETAEGGRKVSWNVVSAAPANPVEPVVEKVVVKGKTVLRQVHVASPHADKEAAAALDRITFPKEVQDRVAPYLHVGSSLIVSDLGPSFETGRATDFIVQTKGEEEAIASVKRIIAEKRTQKSRRYADDEDDRPRVRYTRVYRSSSWWD